MIMNDSLILFHIQEDRMSGITYSFYFIFFFVLSKPFLSLFLGELQRIASDMQRPECVLLAGWTQSLL